MSKYMCVYVFVSKYKKREYHIEIMKDKSNIHGLFSSTAFLQFIFIFPEAGSEGYKS